MEEKKEEERLQNEEERGERVKRIVSGYNGVIKTFVNVLQIYESFKSLRI